MLLTHNSNRMMTIYVATIEPPFVEFRFMAVATLGTWHTLLTHVLIIITLQVRYDFPYFSGWDRDSEWLTTVPS